MPITPGISAGKQKQEGQKVKVILVMRVNTVNLTESRVTEEKPL